MFSEKSEQIIKEMVNKIMDNTPKRFHRIPCEIHPRTWIADDQSQFLFPPIIESNNTDQEEQ